METTIWIFFGNEEVHGLDSFEEYCDGEWSFDEDFSRYCEEVDDWDASIPFGQGTNSDSMKVKEENAEEQAYNHTLMAFLINIQCV